MLEKFLAYSLSVIEVATTPEMEEDAEKLIRDAHLLEEAGSNANSTNEFCGFFCCLKPHFEISKQW